jgi:hypothetical protein
MTQKTFPIHFKYRVGWFILLVLVCLFVFGLVIGLTESIWRLSPGWLITFGLLGTMIGWFLGGAKQKLTLYFISGTLFGVILLISVQSEIYQGFYQAYLETFRLQIHLTYPQLFLPNAGPLFYFLYTALNNLNNYWIEISRWLQNLIFRQGGFNILAINLVWGSLVWIALFSMGWLLRRKIHAFTASLPALILLSAVTGFTRQRTSGLIIVLSALLTTMVLSEHLQRENRWENQKVDYSEDLRFDIFSLTVPLVALIMIIATIIPRVSLENIRTLLFDQQRQSPTATQFDIPEYFGLEQAPVDPLITSSQAGMPRSHLIGSGFELTETVIMEIDTGETYLPPQVASREQPPRYYWFGRSFDIYMGSGWMTGEIRMESVPANEAIISEIPPSYRSLVHQIEKTDAASKILYFTGILNAVDQDITVAWHETTGDYFAAQLNALEYQVTTSSIDYSEEQLRQLDQIPPEFVRETYLQVPPELPERVIKLALSLTNQAKTPYEKAKIIESYLRQYEYSLDLPTPPQDRDLVDYFLFDLQKGYCDYYASTMVILARLNGLPARLAVGYAPGSYDYTHQVFVVTEANAHAWPEVYIEPIGWVPFEPTASLSVQSWSIEDDIIPPDLPPIPREEGLLRPGPVWKEFMGAGILIVMILLTGYLWFILYRHRDKQQSATAQIEMVYRKMQRHLTQRFFKIQTEHTPREFCLVYTKYLNQISSPRFAQKLSRQISIHITFITNLYEKGVYTPHKLPTEQLRQARKQIIQLHLQAWLLKAALLF